MSVREKLSFAVLTGTLAAFPWLTGLSRSFSHYTDVMIFAGIFCLVTLGLSLLMGFAGQISLAQAAFFGIGAYSSGILTVHFHWNPWAALLAGAGAAAAVAWMVGVPALRLKGHYLAMATLGFGVIVHILLNEEVDWTGGPSGFGGIPGLSVAGRKISGEVAWFYLVWGIVLVTFLFRGRQDLVCDSIRGARTECFRGRRQTFFDSLLNSVTNGLAPAFFAFTGGCCRCRFLACCLRVTTCDVNQSF